MTTADITAITRAIRRACPDATQIWVEPKEASFRSWSFAKEPEDAGWDEQEREAAMIQRLQAALPGWAFERGDKNYFDGWMTD